MLSPNEPITTEDFKPIVLGERGRSAEDVFTLYFHGLPNVMTPKKVSVEYRGGKLGQGRFVVEISRGEWLYEPIYGITTLIVTDDGIAKVPAFTGGGSREEIDAILNNFDEWCAGNQVTRSK